MKYKMAFKILLCIIICCSLPNNADALKIIKYKIENCTEGDGICVNSLNANSSTMPITDTFIVLREKIEIRLYYNNSGFDVTLRCELLRESGYDLNRVLVLINNQLSSYSYFLVPVEPKRTKRMTCILSVQLKYSDVMFEVIDKQIIIHFRPTENELPYFYNSEEIIPIQIADFSIEDFHGFSFLYYKRGSSLKLSCASANNDTKVNWDKATLTKYNSTCSSNGLVCSVQINGEDEPSYIDCSVMHSQGSTITRLFLKSSSFADNDCNINLGWKIGASSIAINILFLMAFVINKLKNKIGKEHSDDDVVHRVNENVPQDNERTLQNPRPTSEHLYCYIDPETVVRPVVKPKNIVTEMRGQSNHSNLEQAANSDNIYSYAYVFSYPAIPQ